MYRNSEQYYEMKYYKYKAKIEKLKEGSNHERNTNMDLLHACNNQNIGRVMELLDVGVGTDFEYRGNETILSLVLSRYDFNMEIFTLLVQSSSPEIFNRKYGNNDNTLLHLVLEYHENLEEHLEEILRLLLDNGAIESFNEANRDGETIFYLACDYNLLNVVRFLLDYEPRYNEFLQNSPRDIEPSNIVNTVYRGNTPLYIACRNGNIEIVRHLLQHGAKASINEGNNNSHDLEVEVNHDLFILQQRQNVCVLRDPEPLKKYNGHTPLFIAYIKNDRDLVLLLLQNEANPIVPELSNKDNYYKECIFFSLSEEERIRIYREIDVELENIMNRKEINDLIDDYADQVDRHKKGAKSK